MLFCFMIKKGHFKQKLLLWSQVSYNFCRCLMFSYLVTRDVTRVEWFLCSISSSVLLLVNQTCFKTLENSKILSRRFWITSQDFGHFRLFPNIIFNILAMFSQNLNGSFSIDNEINKDPQPLANLSKDT